MIYPLTIKLPKEHLDLDLNGITPREILADINAFEGVVPVYNEDTKKSEYTFSYIKQDMLSQSAFMALSQVPDIEAEGVILYVVVNTSLLDEQIPETFPNSAIVTVDEDEVETSTQVTYRDYFDVRAEDDDKAVLCLRYKRAGSTGFNTSDYPNMETFTTFYTAMAAEMIEVNGDVLLSMKGANDYISTNFTSDEEI